MSNQYLKLRRSSVPGKVPDTSSIDFGEIALNTYDGLAFIKKSGSFGEQVVILGAKTGDFTGSFSGSFTGSLYGTASYSDTASYLNPLNQTVILSGSIAVSNNITASNALINGTITAQTLVVSTVSSSVVYSSGSNIFGNNLNNTQTFTGSVNITGSLTLNGNETVNGKLTVTNGISGSLFGTASQATSASYAYTASSAINASASLIAVSASYAYTASSAINASASLIAVSASYAYTASSAISSSFANSGTGRFSGSFTGSFNGSFSGSISNLNGATGHIAFFDTPNTISSSAMYQSGGYSIVINQENTTTGAPEALYVWQPNTASFNVISGKGNLNNYLQLNIQNVNNGTSASSDVVATATNGNEFARFIDMGINGENYIDNGNGIGAANDAYLYATGKRLYIGNLTTQSMHLFVGTGSSYSGTKLLLKDNNLHELTGSLNISSSLVVGNGITGSLFGTASQAVSASYAYTASSAISASFAVNYLGSGSISTRITNLETTSSNLVAASASFSTRITSDSSSFSTRITSDSSSFSSRVTSIEATTASLQVASASFSVRTTNLETTASNLVTASGSFSTRVSNTEVTASNLVAASSSFSVRVSNTEVTASNLVAASASFSTRITNDSSSFSSRVTSIEATTASLQLASASFSTRVTNTETTASNLVAASASFSTRTTVLEGASASFSTRTTSLEGASGSFSTRVTQIERTYATTGSNVFTGSQSILGAITASNALINGTLTAQTLVVTTVSSSVVYSSGSNVFGNSTANTQTFTGSVNITGSLTLYGNETINGSSTATLGYTGSLYGTASWAQNFLTSSVTSASYAFTASSAISASYAYTASSAINASASLISVSSSYAFTASSAISASYSTNVSGGIAGYVPLWSGSSTLGNSYLFQSGSVISMNSTTPSYDAYITNGIYVNSGGFKGNGYFRSTSGQVILYPTRDNSRLILDVNAKSLFYNTTGGTGTFSFGVSDSGYNLSLYAGNVQAVLINSASQNTIVGGSNDNNYRLQVYTSASLSGALLVSGSTLLSGSLTTSGSFTLVGNETISGSSTATGGYTGSLFGTASWAQNFLTSSVTSASYAFTASSATNAFQSVSSSYAYTASSAINASASLIAVSASYSYTASSAINASASLIAVSASYAYTASSAINASASLIAVSSSYAYTASSAISASYAYTASSAINASASLIAISASYAAIAANATSSLTASYVLPLSQSVIITGSLIVTGSSINYVSASSFTSNKVGNSAYSISQNFDQNLHGTNVPGIQYNVSSGGGIRVDGGTGGYTNYKNAQVIINWDGPVSNTPIQILRANSIRLSIVDDVVTNNIFKFTGNGSEILSFNSFGRFDVTSSALISGSFTLIGNEIITGSSTATGGYTGSLFGTASWAQNFITGSVTSASYAYTASSAISASIASNSILLNGTSSYAFITTGSNYFSGSQIFSGSIRLDPTQDPGINPTASSYLFVSASKTVTGNDLYIRQDGNLVKWKWIEGALQTGLLYGGAITYSSSFAYVSSGSGIIVNYNASTGSEISPIISYVSWPSQSKNLASNITSSQATYLYIDASGSLQTQDDTFFTNSQYAQVIPLGMVNHTGRNSITSVSNNSYTSYNTTNQAFDFIETFGPLKVAGLTLTGQSGTLRLNVGAGESFILGGFYQTDPNNISHKTTSAYTTASIARVWRSGSTFNTDNNGGSFYTVIDPTQYDSTGTGTLTAVPGGSYSIQRVFFNPFTGRCHVYYGQEVYNNLANAVSNLAVDSFNEAIYTAHQYVFVAYLIVQGSASDLTNTSQCTIVQAGIFRNTAGSSGNTTFVTRLADLSDVSITTPSTGQALIYSGGTWVNGTPTNASTASYVLNAVSSSYAYTASSAISSSYAYTASSAISASLAQTASYVGQLNQSVNISGSLGISGSFYTPSLATNSILFVTTSNQVTGSLAFTYNDSTAGITIGTTSKLGSITLQGSGNSVGISANSFGDHLILASGKVTEISTLQVFNALSLRNNNSINAAKNSLITWASSVDGAVGVADMSLYRYASGSLAIGLGSNTAPVGNLYLGKLIAGSNVDNGFILQVSGSTSASGSLWVSGSSVLSGSLSTVGPFTLIGNEIITGSSTATGGYTGSLFGTASWAQNFITSSVTSASYAYTASSAISASVAQTASYVNMLNQNVNVSGAISVYQPNGPNASIINTNTALILQGAAGGTQTSKSELRITANNSMWVDALTASYFQIRTTGSSTNNNAVFMGGTYGADSPFDRLQFDSNYTQFTNAANPSNTLIPTASFEVLNQTSGSTPLMQLKTAVAQNANYINVTSGSTATAGNVFNITKDGIVAIGTNATSTESNLFLGGLSANEGGQLTLQPGLSYTSGAMLDNYQDQIRILRGNATASNAAVAVWNLTTRQMTLAAYTGSGVFSGTAVANLGVDASGNVITVSSSLIASASYATSASYAYTASSAINASASLIAVSSSYAFTASSAISASNALTASYVPASAVVGLNLSQISTGSVSASVGQTSSSFQLISGSTTFLYVSNSGNIGVNTVTPAYTLDVSGSARVQGNITIGDGATIANSKDIIFASNRYVRLQDTGLNVTNWYGANTQYKHMFGFGGNSLFEMRYDSSFHVGLAGVNQFSLQLQVTATENQIQAYRNAFNVDVKTLRIFTSDPFDTGATARNSGNIAIQTGTGVNGGLTGSIQFQIGNSTNTVATFTTANSLIIGTTTDVTSSILTLASTTKGFLQPRMSTAQRNAISNPAQGLMIYSTSSGDEGIWYYNSGSYQAWTRVLNDSGSQVITGSLNVIQGITGSLFGTASQATSASYAYTASSATNSTTALTASSADNFFVRNTITASAALINGTITAQTLVVNVVSSSIDYSSGSNIFGSSTANTQTFTGSVNITGSGVFLTNGSFSGSGANLYNIPATGITGLNLSQIATGSVTASVGQSTSSFQVVSGSTTLLYVSSSGTLTTNNNIIVSGSIIFGGGSVQPVSFVPGNSIISTILNNNYISKFTINGYQGFVVANGATIGFSSTGVGTTFLANSDVAFTRVASSVMALGNGVSGNTAGTLITSTFSGSFLNLSGSGLISGSLIVSSSTSASALALQGSGSAVFSIDGTTGRLFQVDDSLSGSLFSVNTISGLPVIEAFSDNRVNIGKYNQEAIRVSSSFAFMTGSLFGTASWAQNALTASYFLTSSVTSASFATSASYAYTASSAVNASASLIAVSASYSYTASSAINASASLIAVSASYSYTASSAINASASLVAISASYAFTASSAISAYTASSAINASASLVSVSSSYAFTASSAISAYTASSSVSSSYAFTASSAVNATNAISASNFTITNTLTFDSTLTDYAAVASTIVGTNNVFAQNTGSYRSGFFKYTAINGTNARSGEVMASWNGANIVFTDFATTDIGATNDVTMSAALAGGTVQFNAITQGSGWNIRSIGTYM